MSSMSWQHEHAAVIARYIKAIKGKDVSTEEIIKYPMKRRQKWYFQALAHFQESNYYASTDLVENPEEGMVINVPGVNDVVTYKYNKQKWERLWNAPYSIYD